MKVINFLIILMIFPLAIYASSERDSVLLRAEQYYQQSEYSKVISEYRSLIDDGWASAALFYNLGNAYFKINDIKSAILYYERAKRLAPNDEAINQNLEFTRSLIFDRVEALPEHFIVKWGKAIRDLTTVRAWAWWSVASFVVTLVLCFLFLFLRNVSVRRFAVGFGIFCFALSLTTFTLGYLQKSNIERTDEAIVFAPSVTIKSSPTDSGNNLFIIHEGLKVRIEDRIGEWVEIRIPDGNKGWMRITDLEVI